MDDPSSTVEMQHVPFQVASVDGVCFEMQQLSDSSQQKHTYIEDKGIDRIMQTLLSFIISDSKRMNMWRYLMFELFKWTAQVVVFDAWNTKHKCFQRIFIFEHQIYTTYRLM